MKFANEDLQRLTFELLRADNRKGTNASVLPPSLAATFGNSGRKSASCGRKCQSSRIETRGRGTNGRFDKNAMQDAQNKEKEEEEEEAIGIDIAASAVLSGIHSRQYSPKHASTRFDPNKHEMFRAGAASTPVSKMSRLDQITPALMSATSNFTTRVNQQICDPMVDASMSSIMKSKSGNAIAHERSGTFLRRRVAL